MHGFIVFGAAFILGVTMAVSIKDKIAGKDECEADLPRSQFCVLIAVPYKGER